MKKILILVVLLAVIAGAYFFLSKPDPSSGSASEEQGSEVANTSNKAILPDEPNTSSVDTEEMVETNLIPETEPLTKLEPVIEETVREDVAQAIESSAEEVVDLVEEVTPEVTVVEEIAEQEVESVVAEIQSPVVEEIGVDSAANAAATVEEAVTVVDDQESMQMEAAVAAEAMATEISANTEAMVEEIEEAVDPREELFTKLEAMVASGSITKDQFALLTAAMAASTDDVENSEIATPEWLLDPPAIDWASVAARIQSLKDTGSITDEQFGKFQSNIAKYQPAAETHAQVLDSAANQSVSEIVSINQPSETVDASQSDSASKYDVRINGYPLPSHLSSNLKFSIVELFLNRDKSAVSSQSITINNYLVPQTIDPTVLGKLFDLLISKEASE